MYCISQERVFPKYLKQYLVFYNSIFKYESNKDLLWKWDQIHTSSSILCGTIHMSPSGRLLASLSKGIILK